MKSLLESSRRYVVLTLTNETHALSDAEITQQIRAHPTAQVNPSGIRCTTFQLAQLGLLQAEPATPRRYRRTPAGSQVLLFRRPVLSRQMARTLVLLGSAGQNLRQLKERSGEDGKAILRGLQFLERAGLIERAEAHEAQRGYRLLPEGEALQSHARHLLRRTFAQLDLLELSQACAPQEQHFVAAYHGARKLGSVSGTDTSAEACPDFGYWLTQWLLAQRHQHLRGAGQNSGLPTEAHPALAQVAAALSGD